MPQTGRLLPSPIPVSGLSSFQELSERVYNVNKTSRAASVGSILLQAFPLMGTTRNSPSPFSFQDTDMPPCPPHHRGEDFLGSVCCQV